MWIAWIEGVVDAAGNEKSRPMGINPENVTRISEVTLTTESGSTLICTEIKCIDDKPRWTLLPLEEVAERLSARGARSSGRAPGRPDYSGVRFSNERQG